MTFGFLDLDAVDLIGAAPKMQSHGVNVSGISRDFGRFSIYVIAHPKRQERVRHDQQHRQRDKKPEPPVT